MRHSSTSGEGSSCRAGTRWIKRRCSSTSWSGCSFGMDDRTEAEGYRDLSGSGRAPATKAYADAIEGLLEVDPERAIDRLRAAADEFERCGLRVMQARVLADLGEALVRAGEDPRPTLERARDLLVECDARIYLPEVDALLAHIAAGAVAPVSSDRSRRSNSSTSSTRPAATWRATWRTSRTCSAATSSSRSRRWERGSRRSS